jgi:hypothetical protein
LSLFKRRKGVLGPEFGVLLLLWDGFRRSVFFVGLGSVVTVFCGPFFVGSWDVVTPARRHEAHCGHPPSHFLASFSDEFFIGF